VSEATIQRAIIATLEGAGYVVVRIHSGRLKFNGSWLRLAPEGFPDLWVVGSCLLEVKAPKGRLSVAQAAMHEKLRRAGEMVHTVTSCSEALKAVRGGKVRGHLGKLGTGGDVGKEGAK